MDIRRTDEKIKWTELYVTKISRGLSYFRIVFSSLFW